MIKAFRSWTCPRNEPRISCKSRFASLRSSRNPSGSALPLDAAELLLLPLPLLLFCGGGGGPSADPHTVQSDGWSWHASSHTSHQLFIGMVICLCISGIRVFVCVCVCVCNETVVPSLIQYFSIFFSSRSTLPRKNAGPQCRSEDSDFSIPAERTTSRSDCLIG